MDAMSDLELNINGLMASNLLSWTVGEFLCLSKMMATSAEPLHVEDPVSSSVGDGSW